MKNKRILTSATGVPTPSVNCQRIALSVAAFVQRYRPIEFWTHRILDPMNGKTPATEHPAANHLTHTVRTLMLRRGMPLEVISRILGHAKVSISLGVYRHVLESEKRAEMIDDVNPEADGSREK